MEVIHISSKTILAKITEKLGLPKPAYGHELHNGRYIRLFADIILNQEVEPLEVVGL